MFVCSSLTTTASVLDGYEVTLVANAAGFTYSFTGIESAGGAIADISGTFAAGEFASNFGASHFYSSLQRRFATSTTMDTSEASIDVVPDSTVVPGMRHSFRGVRGGMAMDWKRLRPRERCMFQCLELRATLKQPPMVWCSPPSTGPCLRRMSAHGVLSFR